MLEFKSAKPVSWKHPEELQEQDFSTASYPEPIGNFSLSNPRLPLHLDNREKSSEIIMNFLKTSGLS